MLKSLSLFVILCANSIFLCAQNPERLIVNEDITEYEDVSYQYIESVTLKPDFTFTATSGSSFYIKYYGRNDNTPESLDKNFVRTEVMQVPGIKTLDDVAGLDENSKTTSFSYFDGLGRSEQEVVVKGSVGKKDIVAFSVYNDNKGGREDESHLPYSISSQSGKFRSNTGTEATSFYNGTSKVASDSKPYSKYNYEDSPFQRIDKAYGPGNDWQTNDIGSTGSFDLNTETDIKLWTISNDKPVSTSQYSVKELMVSTATDESGLVTKSYADSYGRIVLSRVVRADNSFLDTYYVYNELGQQRFVIPPLAVSFTNPSTDIMNKLIFQYKYDNQGRLVEQKTPGADWIYTVYDEWDRVVLTQDGHLRNSNDWIFTKYDQYNREIIAGIYHSSASRSSLASTVAGFTNRYESVANNSIGYTLAATFPTSVSSSDLLSITYYDNYDFKDQTNWDTESNNFSLNLPSEISGTQASNALGQTTGSKIKILGENTWLNTVVYYDEDLNPLQAIAENHLGGVDIISSQSDWLGREVKSFLQHSTTNGNVDVLMEYTYDHGGRLLQEVCKFNSEPSFILASYEYNELDQLVEKNLHSTNNGNSFLQSIDYRYNIRGWLTSINNSTLTNDGAINDDNNDLFGIEFIYQNNESGFNSPRYDGNITAVKWMTDNLVDQPKQQIYAYGYDDIQQFKTAEYASKNGSNWTGDLGDYDVTVDGYDDNGNIEGVERFADIDGVKTEIDDLEFTYVANSNQLKNTKDHAQNEYGFDDKLDSGTGTTEYQYNDDGSMKDDLSKEITLITYNILNLPEKVEFYNGLTVDFLYDASGTPLSKTVTIPDADNDDVVIEKIDYIGDIQYYMDEIAFVGTSEGRAIQFEGYYFQEYYLTDHLGNTRVTFGNLPDRSAYQASMESEYASEENNVFEVSASRNTSQNHTQFGNESLLQASVGTSISKMLPVSNGDIISMEIFARYDAGETGSNVDPVDPGILSTILTSFGISNGGATQEAYDAFTDLFGTGATGLFSGGSNNTTNEPAAYLQYIIFDNAYNHIQSGHAEISYHADDRWEQLSISDITVPVDGYMYIYAANEEEGTKVYPAYFDDFLIVHEKSGQDLKVSSTMDYYPYGMPFPQNFEDESEEENNFRYQGTYSEWDKSTNWNMFALRAYQPEIGRWTSVDPYDQFGSPYLGMGNNPIMGTDPDGGWVWWTAAIGAAVGGYTAGAISGGWDPGKWERKDWMWAAGGFVGGGLLGGAMFRQQVVAMSGGGKTYKYIPVDGIEPIWKGKPIDFSNINVDLGKFKEDLADFVNVANNSGQVRRMVRYLNKKNKVRRTKFAKSAKERRLSIHWGNNEYRSADNTITWNSTIREKFDIDNTVEHPSGMLLIHELWHAYLREKFGYSYFQAAAIPYQMEPLREFWKSPAEEYSVKQTNKAIRKVNKKLKKANRISPRVGYGKGSSKVTKDVWDTKPLKGKKRAKRLKWIK